MDFFQAQDAARRRTGWLVALFAAAVLAIVAVVYAVAFVGLRGGDGPLLDPILLAQVVLGVGLVVGGGSAARTASLRAGGGKVAELVGGRRVASDTSDPDERRLLNVVEEMSIASGTPVPGVYVLDGEEGINAFAAGHTIHDAAVAVTRGGLQKLTRDELQGVVAHEFSHILNGDMRLNVRLMGVLYGILLLAIVGRVILYAGQGGRRSSRDGGAGWILLLGVALLLVGYVGVFFGKLIKAAVSRQREYLADSAAVQFTRNPEGLAGALRKIGAEADGGRVRDPHAEELSHLFFANGLKKGILGGLATHPPLEERIRRIDPSWDGSFEVPAPTSGAAAPRPTAAIPRIDRAGAVAGLAAGAAMVASVGAPTPRHLAYAAALLERFPEALTRAVHDPVDARAAVLALVSATGAAGEAERGIVREYGGAEMVQRFEALLPLVRAEGPDAPLALLDLALPALQRLAPQEAARFRAAVERLVAADGLLHPFEFALVHTLARRLAGTERARGWTGRSSLPGLAEEVEVVLSAVARAGGEAGAENAFRAGVARLPPPARGIRLRAAAEVDLARVDAALTALEDTTPAARRVLLEACAAAAGHDGVLHRAEAELLRAVAEALDAPMPPALPTR
jgi:Zn-dependent protease with chaperone function